MSGDIILGYDGQAGADSALAVAVTVAKAFRAPLTIVFGYEPNPMGGETADYQRQLEKIGNETVAKAVKVAGELDATIQVDTMVVALRPVEALLAAAAEHHARVIVVGGTGERPLVGAILGSTPHKLLHRSKVPLLVVPAG